MNIYMKKEKCKESTRIFHLKKLLLCPLFTFFYFIKLPDCHSTELNLRVTIMREDKGGGEDDAKTVSGTSTALQRPPVQRLKGKRVRDEFVCPITCEIMMEPVVASDGHSYENAAISKWMSVKDQSPRTGEPLVRIVYMIQRMIGIQYELSRFIYKEFHFFSTSLLINSSE